MKKTRKLIPAIAMLLVSLIVMSSASFAWFSMNKQVTATGMKVQARAEEGLVISNSASGTYDRSADSAKTTVSQLYPGSTADLTTFLHSTSTNPGVANTQQTYTTGTEWTGNSGEYGNYVVHDFYIRSSSSETLTVGSLNIESVVANAGSQNLSKALRVGVKIQGSSNTYIYAPVTGYTTSVSVQKAAGPYSAVADDRTNVLAIASGTQSSDTSITSIPANSVNGLNVKIYIWYEGEDAACISDNIISGLEEISVTVDFSYTAA